MKKLSTISLIIFIIFVTAILTAGLVFYQNTKVQTAGNTPINIVAQTITQVNPTNNRLSLNMAEIAKHNSSTDCWLLISGKVYNITSFFGSHPGGDRTMAPTCVTDATIAYATKDPNASSTGGRGGHSSKAKSMLSNYYLGDLNQTITK